MERRWVEEKKKRTGKGYDALDGKWFPFNGPRTEHGVGDRTKSVASWLN